MTTIKIVDNGPMVREAKKMSDIPRAAVFRGRTSGCSQVGLFFRGCGCVVSLCPYNGYEAGDAWEGDPTFLDYEEVDITITVHPKG